jgi:hypothetical protein
MPRWFDDAAHSDPHRPAPLGRAAMACVVIYTIGAVIGWALVGTLVAWVML